MAINLGQTHCNRSLQVRLTSSVLLKWRSSLYKLCFKEFLFLIIPYITLSIVYRLALDDNKKRLFEELVRYFDQYLRMISLPFILGFYVTTVAARWWQQYMALPWPDRLVLTIATYVPGSDAKSRLLRKTLVRQCNLMAVLLLRGLSNPKTDTSTILENVVKAGSMTKEEKLCYESINSDVNLFWLPGLWFTQNLQSAYRQGWIKDTYGTKLIMEEFLEFRGRCGTLWTYAWINIPLIYTQVVTLAANSFFMACIIGRQRIVDPDAEEEIMTDFYIGMITVLQFFFYMGLLKVAEQMIIPYGDDDEHFDLDFLLDRHSKVIDLGTDVLSDTYPSLTSELLDQDRNETVLLLDTELGCKKQSIAENQVRVLNSTVSSGLNSVINRLRHPSVGLTQATYETSKGVKRESGCKDNGLDIAETPMPLNHIEPILCSGVTKNWKKCFKPSTGIYTISRRQNSVENF